MHLLNAALHRKSPQDHWDLKPDLKLSWGRRGFLPAVASLCLLVATWPGAALAQDDNPLLPKNLSPWGMFLNADIVVKAVMIGLAFASLVTWTVWLAKSIELRVARSRALRRMRLLEEGRS